MLLATMYICSTPPPPGTKEHTTLLKDQQLILSLSPAWAIISLIIQNLGHQPDILSVCVCAYMSLREDVSQGVTETVSLIALKKKDSEPALGDICLQCSLQTAACGLNWTPACAHTSTWPMCQRCHV